MPVTVRTKEELDRAIKNKEDTIIVRGDLAEQVNRIENLRTLGPIALTVLGAAVALIPFTAGLSSPLVVAAAATAGLSPVVILAIIAVGGILVAYAISRDYTIKFKAKGPGYEAEVILERKSAAS